MLWCQEGSQDPPKNANPPILKSPDQPTDRPTDRPTDQPTDQLTDRRTELSINILDFEVNNKKVFAHDGHMLFVLGTPINLTLILILSNLVKSLGLGFSMPSVKLKSLIYK